MSSFHSLKKITRELALRNRGSSNKKKRNGIASYPTTPLSFDFGINSNSNTKSSTTNSDPFGIFGFHLKSASATPYSPSQGKDERESLPSKRHLFPRLSQSIEEKIDERSSLCIVDDDHDSRDGRRDSIMSLPPLEMNLSDPRRRALPREALSVVQESDDEGDDEKKDEDERILTDTVLETNGSSNSLPHRTHIKRETSLSLHIDLPVLLEGPSLPDFMDDFVVLHHRGSPSPLKERPSQQNGPISPLIDQIPDQSKIVIPDFYANIDSSPLISIIEHPESGPRNRKIFYDSSSSSRIKESDTSVPSLLIFSSDSNPDGIEINETSG